MADEAEDTGTPIQQGGKGQKSLMDQARDAVLKQGKDALMNKLKELAKKEMEHQKGLALVRAEAAKLVEDYEAGVI